MAATGVELKSSFFSDWESTVYDFESSFINEGHARPFKPNLFRQKNITLKILDGCSKFDFVLLIARRLTFFFDNGDMVCEAKRICDIYRSYVKTVGPKMVTTHLRTVTNH